MDIELVLGIDPSRGWALCEHFRKRIVDAGSVPGINSLLTKINELSEKHKIIMVRIEKPRNRHVYMRPGANISVMQNIAVKVGENMAKADQIKLHCDNLGLRTSFIAPIRGGTKRNKEFIRKLTRFNGRTNEHSRDAIVIAWG